MDEQRKSENALAPALRFEGFADPWEQRKLGEVFDEYAEKGHTELPALTIIQGGGTILRDESDRMLQYDKTSLSGYKLVNAGDFILHLRSFEGGLELATRKGLISPAYHTFHGQEVDPRFYYSYFRSSHFIDRSLRPHVYGIRDGRSINVAGMKTIRIPYTNIKEQRTIGVFIECLDSLITLHQRKHEKLKAVKQSLLEKMFPKEGESVPELRFEGFTDPWEQRKLGEILRSLSTGKSVNSLDEPGSNGDICILKTSCVSGNKFNSDERKRVAESELGLARCPVEKDTLIISRMNTPELVGSCGYCAVDMGNLFLPDRLWKVSFGESASPYFIFTVLASLAYQEKLKSSATGTSGSMKNISQPSLLNFEIPVAELSEQSRIGTLFQKLDSLITLHQRELEILKNLKKALLEKMFV